MLPGTSKASRGSSSAHLQWTQGSRGAKESKQTKKPNPGWAGWRGREERMEMRNFHSYPGGYLLLGGLCTCCSLGLECPFHSSPDSYSSSLSSGISSSRKPSEALLFLPLHPSWAHGSHPPLTPSLHWSCCLPPQLAVTCLLFLFYFQVPVQHWVQRRARWRLVEWMNKCFSRSMEQGSSGALWF